MHSVHAHPSLHSHVSALHAALVRVLRAVTEQCLVVQISAQLYCMEEVELFFPSQAVLHSARLAQSASPGALC